MKIKVRTIEGYRSGSIVEMEDTRAKVYVANGQAEAVEKPKPKSKKSKRKKELKHG